MAKVIEARELGYIIHLNPPKVVVSLRFLLDGKLIAIRITTYPLSVPIYDLVDMLKDEYGADEVHFQPLLNLE
jgi:hypothetical protein